MKCILAPNDNGFGDMAVQAAADANATHVAANSIAAGEQHSITVKIMLSPTVTGFVLLIILQPARATFITLPKGKTFGPTLLAIFKAVSTKAIFNLLLY